MDIDRKLLLASIARVVPGISKKELFDQSDKLVFSEGYLASYNDEVSIFDLLPGSEDITGAVDGHRFYGLIGKLGADLVHLTVDGDQLLIKSGRTSASFSLLPITLPIGEVDGTGNAQSVPAGFTQSLKLVSGSCSRDMMRPVLTCVSFQGDVIEASDVFRMAKVEFRGFNLPTALLPASSAEVIAGFDVQQIAIGDNGEWIRFATESDQTIIFARLMSGNFPDLSQFYGVDGSSVRLPDLSDVIARAEVFFKRSRNVDEQVSIELKATEVEVKATCDGGQFNETLRWRNKDAVTAQFKIHPDFLAEALKNGKDCVVGDDKIKFIGENWQHVIALQ